MTTTPQTHDDAMSNARIAGARYEALSVKLHELAASVERRPPILDPIFQQRGDERRGDGVGRGDEAGRGRSADGENPS